MKKMIAVIFLCLVMLLSGCTVPAQETVPSTQETTLPATILWTPVYNDHSVCGLQISMMLPKGSTKRDLTEAEIAAVVPASLLAGGRDLWLCVFPG